MDRLFTFVQTYRAGILLLLFSLAVLAALVQWFAWIFGLGRFGRDLQSGSKALTIAFSEFVFKIINEFRHLLALLVFMVFTVALIYSLIKAANIPQTGADSPSTISNMKEALQAVVATLGGLVGSIIGYYFGESSAVKGASTLGDSGGSKPTPEIQAPPTGNTPSTEPITPIERPGT
jgi:hypothetical protein